MRKNIFLIIIIFIILAKIFNFYDLLKSKVLKISNPYLIYSLYHKDIEEVSYINDDFLRCVNSGVISYIGSNELYNDYIIVSSKNSNYLYYNIEKIDLYLYKYLNKNDIISYKYQAGVIKID